MSPRAAIFLGPGRGHEIREVPSGRLGEGEGRVRVSLCTICGSDVRTHTGARGGPLPCVLGHEAIGELVEIGPRWRGPARVGDRVAWSIAATCGDCGRCRRGLEPKCERLWKYGHEVFEDSASIGGGFATEVILRAGTHVVPLPSGTPDEVFAPVGCATATAAACLRAAEDVSGLDVLVLGGGALGLTAAAMAHEGGAARIALVDPDERRRSLAPTFGASDALAPAELDGVYDVVLEASGAAAGVRAGIDALAVGGRAILAGTVSPVGSVELDPERMVRGLHRVEGVHNYRAADLDEAVRFLTAYGERYPFAGLVGACVGLDDIDEGFAASARGAHARIAVRPGD